MKPETKYGFVEISSFILMGAILISGLIGGIIGSKQAQNRYENFLGANITTTTLQNTINDFRNNVNNSLININDQLTSSTAINPGHKHTSSSIQDWMRGATSSLGNASGTNMDLSGYLTVLGSSTIKSLSFNSASGTGSLSLTGFLAAGNIRGTSFNNTGNSTLANVSGTALTATAFLQAVNLNITGQSILNGGVSSTGNITFTGNVQAHDLVDGGNNKFATSTKLSFVVWYPNGGCILGANVTEVVATSSQPHWLFADGAAGSINCMARVPTGVSQVSSTFVYFLGQGTGNIEHFERWSSANLGTTITTDEPAGATTTSATANNQLQRLLPQATGYDGLDTDLKEDDMVGFEFSRNAQNAGDTYNTGLRVYYIVLYFK